MKFKALALFALCFGLRAYEGTPAPSYFNGYEFEGKATEKKSDGKGESAAVTAKGVNDELEFSLLTKLGFKALKWRGGISGGGDFHRIDFYATGKAEDGQEVVITGTYTNKPDEFSATVSVMTKDGKSRTWEIAAKRADKKK